MVVQLVLCLQHLPFFMSQLNCSSVLPLQCKHCPCSAQSFCFFLWKLKHDKAPLGLWVPFSVLVTGAVPRSRAPYLCHVLHKEWRILLYFF